MWDYVKFRKTLSRLDQYAFLLFIALLFVLEAPVWTIVAAALLYLVRLIMEALSVTEMEDRMEVPRVGLSRIN